MTFGKNDNGWEEWGNDEPYFSVLTQEKYKSTNINTMLKSEFFQSGYDYVEYILKKNFKLY